MAAVTSAVLGAASLGYGIFSKVSADKKAKEAFEVSKHGALIQAQASKELADISREQAATQTAFAGREYDINEAFNKFSAKTFENTNIVSRNMVNNQRQQDALRMQAMELDASRKTREIVRNQQRARSVAVTNANAQGALGGSGLFGGFGQIQGQSGVNALGVNQSLNQGRQMFGLQNALTDLKLVYSDFENTFNQFRADTQTKKSQLAYDLAFANAGFQDRTATAQEKMSQGQGIVNMGSGMGNMASSASNTANMFINAGLALPGIGTNLGNVFKSNFYQPTAASSTSWSAPMSLDPVGYGGKYYG
jgi:hypothetical protein